MPRKPVKPRAKRVQTTMNELELEYLLLGENMMDGDDPGFKSDEEARQCWEQNRDFVLSLQKKTGDGSFITKGTGDVYFDHFTRPWGFWKFDAPEPRRFEMKWHRSNATLDYRYPEYETERAYLERHNLFNEAEKAQIKGDKNG